MEKKKCEKSLIEYFKSINRFVLAGYIFTWILFVIEMVFIRGTWYWDFDKSLNDLITDASKLELYCFVFPAVYVIVNLLIVFLKKINWLSILLLFVLILTYPEILIIVLFRLMELSGGPW